MSDTTPLTEQTISTATGLVKPRIDVCLVDYTTTGAVTDVELDATWIAQHSCTTFVDVDGNAGTNNITIKNTANTVIAIIDNNYGTVTLYSDGTTIYVKSKTSTTYSTTVSAVTGKFDHIGEKTAAHGIALDNNWTAAGRTCADLGTVTTADINGGSADGVTIGAAVPAAATVTTVTANTAGSSIVCEAWHEVGAGGEPAFTNSWVNYGGVYATAAFMKDPFGFVHLKGLVKNGTAGTSIFTLTAGYRPPVVILNNAASADYTTKGAYCVIGTDGTVLAGTTLNAWFSLDGIIFKAA